MTDEQSDGDLDLSTILAGRSWAGALLHVMVASAESDGDPVLVHIAHDAIARLEAAQAALNQRVEAAAIVVAKAEAESVARGDLRSLLFPPDQQ